MKTYDISKKIYELRKQKQWSQKELAGRVGLSQSSIKDIESGRFKLQNIQTVCKFAKVFEVSLNFLFKDILDCFNNIKKSDFEMKIENELYQMDIKRLELAHNIVCKFAEYKKSENSN